MTLTPEAFLERLWSFNVATGNSYNMVSTKAATWEDRAWDRTGIPGQMDLTNLFFTPTVFKEPRRIASAATGKSPWLYADLDEVDPRFLDIKPHLAWETSPGRYQCAWRLDTPLGIRAQERLNKAMTYHTKADKGGWSWTKALRVPGSTSTKHAEPFQVTLLWADWDATLPVDDVRAIVKDALPALDVASGPINLPKQTAREIRREHWKDFSPRLRKLLRARVLHPDDDRSSRLWEVEGLCLAAGLTPGQTVRVAQACIYNKYKGQRREYRKLMEEVSKQTATVKIKATPQDGENDLISFTQEPEESAVSYYAKAELDLLSPLEPPDYVIHGILARGQVCVLSADSGVGKSWVALDLVRACIMRKKWLGRQVIGRKVLYVDEENGLRILNGRLRGLMLTGNDADEALNRLVQRNLHLCSRNGVSIGDDDQQPELEEVIDNLTPSLLIIDTAMSATDVGEVNDNTAVVALMKKLRYLAEKYHLGVVLMHHDRKPANHGDDAPPPDTKGTSMMGARQWSGQADAHLSLVPHDSQVKDLSNGKRGLLTDVILACPKLRDDVPFESEHIRISSIKDSSGRILRASVKSLGPAPERPVEIIDMSTVKPKPFSVYPKGTRETHLKGTGKSDEGVPLLHRMIVGEMMTLEEAAALHDCSNNAMRTRVHKAESFKIDRHQGATVVVRIQ